MDIDGEQQEGAAVAARRRKKVRARCGVSRNDMEAPYFAQCPIILYRFCNLRGMILKDLEFPTSVVSFSHFVRTVVFTWWFCIFRAERVKLSRQTFPS